MIEQNLDQEKNEHKKKKNKFKKIHKLIKRQLNAVGLIDYPDKSKQTKNESTATNEAILKHATINTNQLAVKNQTNNETGLTDIIFYSN